MIRLEWLHARAAVERWREESVLLREEARRLVTGFEEDSKTWTSRSVLASDTSGRSPISIAGYNTFVARQAWVHQCIAHSARHKLQEAFLIHASEAAAQQRDESEPDRE